jgi:hypothetical protein
VDKETRNLILIGGGVIAAYFIITNWLGKGIAAVASVTNAIGTATGGWLWSLFNGDPGATNSVYHITTFPDGSSHAVSSDWVNPGNGQFTWYTAAEMPGADGDGNNYQLSYTPGPGGSTTSGVTWQATGPL